MMNKFRYKLSHKNKNFRFILFVLTILFISENGFAQKFWKKEYMRLYWDAQRNLIIISTTVYNYSLGTTSDHGFLEYCEFEASVDNKNYFKLMEIHTIKQIKLNHTIINLKNKLNRAKMIFAKDIITSTGDSEWPQMYCSNFPVMVPNSNGISIFGLAWSLNQEFADVRYIRSSGRWALPGGSAILFGDLVYDLTKKHSECIKI